MYGTGADSYSSSELSVEDSSLTSYSVEEEAPLPTTKFVLLQLLQLLTTQGAINWNQMYQELIVLQKSGYAQQPQLRLTTPALV